MRRNLSVVMALLVGMVLALSVVALAAAQQKEKPAPAKQQRLSGRVEMIDKDAKIVTLRTNPGNVPRQVVYSGSTKFTFRNKPGSLDDVKDGRRVICRGTFNDKNQFVANRIDVREGR
jgi:Cu/Ag efflux protein CusF